MFEPPPSQLDLRFHLFGTPVRVSPYFWLGAILLGLNPNNFDPVRLFLWVLAVFVSILLHEFGHIWAGRLFGSHGYIVLHGLGGVAVGAARAPAVWQRIVIMLAGPCIQFVLLVPLYLVLRADPPLPWAVQTLLGLLFWINLVWPIFNLVPVWPLDGGQVTREVFVAAAPRRGLASSLYVSIIAALVLTLWALITYLRPQLIPEWLPIRGSLFTVLFFALFAYFSYQELQMTRQRGDYWYEPKDRLPWER